MPLVAFSISIGLIAPSNNAPSTLSALLKHVPSKVTIHTRQIHPVLIFVLYHYPKLVLMKKAFEFCEDFASFVSKLRLGYVTKMLVKLTLCIMYQRHNKLLAKIDGTPWYK